MIDIKLLRRERENIENKLKKKEPSADVGPLLAKDQLMREKMTEVERFKAERNALSKKIGEAKRSGGDATSYLEEAERLASAIHTIDKEVQQLGEEVQQALVELPNIPMDDVPHSPDPADNVIIKEVGEKPNFSFAPKNHVELNHHLHLFDFERSAKLTGAGWPLYVGWGARLEWALLQYMISVHMKNGYRFILPPLAVRRETMYDAGQLPKFENQQFKLDDDDYPYYLIPTAEVPLNGLHADEILAGDTLPLRYASYTPCFRREAGAAGSQERGLIRMHQFNKVEMFAFCRPEESSTLQEEMVASAEEILQGLGLHYRIALLVTGDMSFSSARTLDIEAWLPGQERYYEVSSISNCTDYQARRSKMRYREKGEKETRFLHTLNGSGLATSRLLVSLLECNQNEDGSITVPPVLRPYLDGKAAIKPSEGSL